MNLIDYVLVIILVVSFVLGYARGFLTEAIGLISWLAGLWLAWHFAYLVEPHLGGLVREPPLSTWTARVAILLTVLVIGWLISGVCSYFIQQSGVSLMLDRILGVLFGLIRGVILAAMLAMFGMQLQLNRTDWWEDSRFLPYAAEVATWLKGFADAAAGEKVAAET
jgi:membrane protein required for colicin V production